MIFVYDLSAVITLVLSAAGFALASSALTIALEWLFNHLAFTLVLFAVFLIVSALFKTATTAKGNGRISISVGFVFNLMSAVIELIFTLGYIVPTWVYAGGFYAMGETVASVILFYIACVIGKVVIAQVFSFLRVPPCVAYGLADFIAKGGTFVGFYFVLNGLSCYIFDYLGIAAPFI